MKIKPDANVPGRRINIYVSLVFLLLAAILQILVWAYWDKILEPRLRREAASQANVLAHAQAVKLADAVLDKTRQPARGLQETIDEILLFTVPGSNEPFFLGLALEIDYDVVHAPAGSLDIQHGITTCADCFLSEVGLYSPSSDELMGIARFHVSDRLFRRLSRDVRKTLFTLSHLATLLLLVVWGVVTFLIRETNRARRQAEAASRAKSAFLANMSHELRTPLNAIIGFSELMGFDTDIPPKQRSNIAIIHRSGEYLLELINDVLELSKIEAAQDTVMETVFDLYDTLEKATEMIRLRAEKKNLQIVFERADNVPRYIRTDERKLRQILLNLMGNAVKFTEEGGVTLRVRLENKEEEKSDDWIRLYFEVQDSGPGITPEERTRMFDAFTQTRSGYDKKEGTGLGLAITRQFVEHLGGRIHVDGTEGKGAVFSFTVQVRPAQDFEPAMHRPAQRVIGLKSDKNGSQSQSYRILVVDDHPENRALLQLLLERVGFTVQTARDGHQAVDISKTWQPHLIWMDMRMPVMDGYKATKRIQEAAAERHMKPPIIIALTASAFNEDRDAVFAAGCNDFVRRPFRESEIFAKMAEHLGVAYIYEEQSGAADKNIVAGTMSTRDFKSAITCLPKWAVKELKTAIELSDMERMELMVAEIGRDHGALAGELKVLVESFQFDRILTLLEDSQDGPKPLGGNQ